MERVRPSDCALAFGIPTCEWSFYGALKRDTSHYASKYSSYPEYSEYRRQSGVWLLEAITPALVSAGVNVVTDLTLNDLENLFLRHRVIILFSHWIPPVDGFPQGAVELSDGPAGVEDVIASIPEQFDGYLDLGMCFPESLVEALLAERERCHVKFLRHDADPTILLYFYGELFLLLSKHSMPYADALIRTRKHLLSSDEG